MAEWVVSLVQILLQFCQGLIWPLIFVVLLILNYKRVVQLVDIIIERIKSGDAWRWGQLGMDQSHPQDAYSKVAVVDTSEQNQPENKFSYGSYPEMPFEVSRARVIRLSHRLGPWGKDRDGYTRRSIAVWLLTSPGSLMESIKKVTYYLPDSWPKDLRIKEKTDRSNYFEMTTRAYGEVTVGAKVEFSDGTAPLIINRYCNFYDD